MELAILLFGLGAIAFCHYENNFLDITNIKVKGNVEQNIRIIQLSDLHSKEFGKNNKKLLKSILKSKGDIVFATGDMIDSSMKNMDKIISFLSELNKYLPVIYIPGNNEMRCAGLDQILNNLKKNNIIVLQNQIKNIRIKSNDINILGLVEERVDDGEYFYQKVDSKYLYKDCNKIFRELERREGLKLVLSHYPENFEGIGNKSYCKYNIDIVFSGHAHGGQFILPFIGGLFAPGQGILPKYYKGIHGKESKLIISRGLGNSGFPLRLFNRPEIVIVDIEK
ncbi:metallophosphoesterase [Clostridioides difficile]